MHYLFLTLPSLAENLALDEALLLEAEADRGGEILRFWEWPTPAVVLGAAGRLREEVDEAACQRDQIPILRRGSGGGAVLLGAGCLCYSLILSYQRHPSLSEVRPSYKYILESICSFLIKGAPALACAGVSDLVLAGRKVSGNSQQRKRRYLLHHGTLLYRFDLSLVRRYLPLPARQPAYRQGRPHETFLTNLPLEREELIVRLRQGWAAWSEQTNWPRQCVQELVRDKYACPEWIYRR